MKSNPCARPDQDPDLGVQTTTQYTMTEEPDQSGSEHETRILLS